MENEVKNPTPAMPEGSATEPSCCCKKKLLPVVIAAVLLIAIAAVIACIAIFNRSGKPLPKYAPEGTDVIVHVSLEKISRTKVGAAFKKTLAYERAVKKSGEKEFDPKAAEQCELCIFVDLSGKNPRFSCIARGKDASAEKLFDAAVRKEKKSLDEMKKVLGGDRIPTLSEDKIDGKRAMVEKFASGSGKAMILLDKNTVQFSSGAKDNFVAAPLTAKSIELSNAVDTKALISVAYKFELPDSVREMLKSDDANKFQDITNDLDTVSLNLYDRGDDLELKLEANYANAESAKKACEMLIALRLFGKNAVKDKKLLEVIDSINIEVNDRRITAGVKYSQSKIAEYIEEWDKGERERAKRLAELCKEIEESARKDKDTDKK